MHDIKIYLPQSGISCELEQTKQISNKFELI